ncbi:hypothetical protein [Bifidobacterium callitrichidarum]|uniref:Uncharacterized protein n=1 Tax=Bifidobacterium callitrichidarum TaxID=2052941 RepID=A0A2U2N922_9BIFI|nr:hypothetical protein [Bifidobacterium callitrichidarum]PWG65597.1 hypothetical protein DF196_06595 [Bifidobacterium callitrichidarum]
MNGINNIKLDYNIADMYALIAKQHDLVVANQLFNQLIEEGESPLNVIFCASLGLYDYFEEGFDLWDDIFNRLENRFEYHRDDCVLAAVFLELVVIDAHQSGD